MNSVGAWLMVRGRARRGYLQCVWLVVLALLLLPAATAAAQFRFDGLDFPPAAPGGLMGAGHLTEGMPLSKGGRSIGFLSGVGGVAFGAVAVPEVGMEIVGLAYDPTASDGERLLVSLRRADGTSLVVVSPIADWLLLPTARFAAGEQDAAMTLFGQAATEAETEKQRAAGNDILNYHPAFIDTLAGLRLLHADILVLYQGAAQLPTVDGKLLLGSGEVEGAVANNEQSLRALHQYIETLPGNPFQSYVVGDFEQTIHMSTDGVHLVFDGNPYWHCWKLKTDNQSELDKAVDLANLWANRILKREAEHDSMYLSNTEWTVLYTDAYQRARLEVVFDERLSRAVLLLMPEYSAAMSKQIAALGGINPVVYAALRTTMHHAALFRLVKQTAPGLLEAFIASLAAAPYPAEVQLPLLFHPPV